MAAFGVGVVVCGVLQAQIRACVLEKMEVVYACRSHAEGKDYAAYSADNVEFESVIALPLRGTVSPIRLASILLYYE